MLKEFKIVVDIWSNPDKDGKSKIIKKNIIKKKTLNLNDVTSIEELTNNKGRVLNNLCYVECGEKSVIVKYRYDELLKLMSKTRSANNTIGFKYKNRE